MGTQETDKFVTDFINNPGIFYQKNTQKELRLLEPRRPLDIDDVYLVKMKSITFEEKSPREEAIKNVLSAMRIPCVNFIYLIKGDEKQVSFYYGISRDLIQYVKGTENINISELGNSVLKKSIEGNFRGSSIEVVNNEETQDILREIDTFKRVDVIEGVPGLNNEESKEFQRVDRLIDVMLGDKFIFLVTAKFIPLEGINNIENNIYRFYEKLIPMSKTSLQKGETEGVNTSSTQSQGTNKNTGTATQTGTSTSHSVGLTEGATQGQKSTSKTNSDNTGTSQSSTNNQSIGENSSISTSQTSSKGKSNTTSYEMIDKKVQEWLKYIDDYILKKIDYGKGKGLFTTTITLFSDNDIVMQKLANTTTALFSGENGNKVPLQQYPLKDIDDRKRVLRNLQVPLGVFNTPKNENEIYTRTALSQYVGKQFSFVGNWCSVNELSVIAGLPSKEVVGLSLNEEVEFGLNFSTKADPNNRIPLGNLVQSGNVQNKIEVSIDKKDLDKHVFVCGVTGSGKTTTCMGILKNSGTNYLVIEPAKTEYRILAKYEDVLVFSLGNDENTPFRLNPLEFLPSESISSHVDMLKASIEAAFDMEAAIPQIIESALYECYKKYGWNIHNNTNSNFEDPFADGVFSFPMLSDLINITEEVINKQGFDERLKNDYLGSVRARLMGLTVGAKGEMLNTPRSVNFNDLIKRKVVLELENIKSGSEKSLIMGFILTNLCEAIKEEHKRDEKFRHITLVEEAHRLLSKYMPGDSLNKKNGVETFADMLAEVRKYGECLVIADQIPDKMTPDVLKNTNTKIVHKIFAQDDKEAIGNTMSMSQEQKSFLSNLITGRAIVFSQGWGKSIQVAINLVYNTTEEKIEEQELRQIAFNYYADNYKKGVFPELSCLEEKPSIDKLHILMSKKPILDKLKETFINYLDHKVKQSYLDAFAENLRGINNLYKLNEVASFLNNGVFYSPNAKSEGLLFELINSILEDKANVSDSKYLETFQLLFNKSKKIKLC